MQRDTLLQNTLSRTNFIIEIKNNNDKILKELYQDNFKKVEYYILKNNGSSQQAKDIYQEAFLALWNNIKNDKFIPESKSSINGYIYTIAKNKWTDFLRSNQFKKTIVTSEIFQKNEYDNSTENNDEDEKASKRLEKGMKAFNNLGISCKALLTKFYFEQKSIKRIALELKLDAASTRNKKYRCMMKLRELAQKLK